MMSHLSG